MMVIVLNDMTVSVIAMQENNQHYLENVEEAVEVEEEVVRNDKNSYKFENGLITEVYNGNTLLIKNEYENNLRVKKYGDETCSFVYNDYNQIITENRDGKEIVYDYTERDDGSSMLCGFNIDGTQYYYTYNGNCEINGIKDNQGSILVRYEYEKDTMRLCKVLAFDGANWNACNDAEFIGNINRMHSVQAYYDVETGLYYQNGVFFNPETTCTIMEEKDGQVAHFDLELMSDIEILDYELYCMQQEYLSDADFNGPVTTSTWLVGMSNVEVIARVIYGESSAVLKDQDMVAYVIRNRSLFYDRSVLNVVLNRGTDGSLDFAAATPSSQAMISHSENDPRWANAVYLACLLCTTRDESDWEGLSVIRLGMDRQMNFRSYAQRSRFTYDDDSGNMYFDGYLIKNVYGPTYGIISNTTQLDQYIANYPNQNIYFLYNYELLDSRIERL